jgi:hypothetical protein
MKKYILEPATEYQVKQCELFSHYSVDTSADCYKRRNQTNIEKIIKDIYYGKLAEFMVYNFLISKGKKPSVPDVTIYDKKRKSFDADIISGKNNIHVKCHKVNNLFAISWMFQKTDPLIINGQDNDFLALVVLDEDESYMYLENIKNVIFGLPMKESLRKTKVCLYESSLNLANNE